MKRELKEMIDVEKSQKVMDSFCDVIGVAAAIIDLEGEVLFGSNWQRICTDFHRVNGQTCKRCVENDIAVNRQLSEGKEYAFYRCKNGLCDAAAPIRVGGEHVANAFVGQFLVEEPDVEFFKNQAKKYGFPPKDYLKALSEAPRIPEAKLPGILRFLSTYAAMVAQTVEDHKRQLETEKKIARLARESLELSTPVIQVWDGVVVAPLIGTMDSQRAHLLMERLLNKIVQTQSQVAIVDITGIPAIDTQTAQHLIETVSAAKLLGTRMVLTGIRPSIAQTLVQLGISLTDMETRSTLASGLKAVIGSKQEQIV